MNFILSLFLLFLVSCSSKRSPLLNQKLTGHSELYSEPDSPDLKNNKYYKRIVIASTNDSGGQYGPRTISFKDQFNSGDQEIRLGGVDVISSYFNILRSKYGNLVLLDSGHLFSNLAREMPYTRDYFSALRYDAITLGINDFNLKLPAKYSSAISFFKTFAEKSEVPLILSNLYELKTSQPIDWPGTRPYVLKEVDGVKMGMIGIIPDDIHSESPVKNRIGLYIEKMVHSTLAYARLLRSLGAEIIIVMTHQGVHCGNNLAKKLKLPITKVNFEPEKSDLCDLSQDLGPYLSRLPPNLVDLVIGGRGEQKMVNIINSTIVLRSINHNQSFSFVEFFVDKKTGKLTKDKTVIHQPIMFCHEFFEQTNDCYTEDPSINHKEKIPASFLGEKIQPDLEIQKRFESFLKIK
jgi:2',3'-cyclic-nucleotide 2'-phosphodiesterase (5'-nucleotidase family)